MQCLMNWGVKEIYAKKVNDEENVVGDINEKTLPPTCI